MEWNFSSVVWISSSTHRVLGFALSIIGFELSRYCFMSVELLRNMMGLLGNVSECAHLRYRLMKPDYITRFVQLLESSSDGIEVSYNSAGILAHIASDGAEIWNRHLDEKCSREDMLAKMDEAITRWQVNSKRNINYRYGFPIQAFERLIYLPIFLTDLLNQFYG